MQLVPEWMWMPQLLGCADGVVHSGSTPTSVYEKVCVVPSVVIGPTVPATCSVPVSVHSTASERGGHTVGGCAPALPAPGRGFFFTRGLRARAQRTHIQCTA